MVGSCTEAVDVKAFLQGLLEHVRPCQDLQHLLDLDKPNLALPTLLLLIYRKIEEYDGRFPIPLNLTVPFSPHTYLSKENILDILCHHVRFCNPHHKYMFINPGALPTISVTNLQPHPNNNNPIEETLNMCWCRECGAYLKPENFFAHKEEGPYAEFHSLHGSLDEELQMLLALAVFSAQGNILSCGFCTASYSILYHDSQITEHAKSHASHFLAANENPFTAKEKLWAVVQDKGVQINLCLPCGRFFANTKLYYLHLIISPHYIDKNLCLPCQRYVTNEHMLEHLETAHLLHTTCPFSCTVPKHLMAHHILNRHEQISHVIPRTEILEMKKSIEVFQVTDKVDGPYGYVTLDYRFEDFVKQNCSLEHNMDLQKKYGFIDSHAWQICDRLLSARRLRRKLRPTYSKQVQINPNRFLTKLLIKARQTLLVSRQEDSTVIFQIPAIEKQNFAFPSELKAQYTKDILDKVDVVLIGNDLFSQLSSNTDIRLLNLSTTNSTIWSYRNFGQTHPDIPDDEIMFDDYIQTTVQKIHRESDITIILEASLRPLLEKIPAGQRVLFLQRHFRELVRSFLMTVIEVQKKFKSVVVATYLHLLKSEHFSAELAIIAQYNELIRVSCLYLQCGLLELDTLQVVPVNTKTRIIYLRANTFDSRSLCDNSGNLTVYGHNSILDLICTLESERRLLLEQITGE